MLRVVARNLAENAIRYAGPGATFTLSVERDGGTVVALGRDDGDRRRRGGAAAALRALLSRRPGACVAWDGARARDREAHRHAGGRDGRGAGSARARARGALRVPGARSASPDRHHIFTSGSPARTAAAEETGGMSMRALLRCSVCRRVRARARRLRRGRRAAAGATITADGSSTVGPFVTKAAEDFKAERRSRRHGRHLRHRRRLRALLRRRDGHLERVARDRRGGGGDCARRTASSTSSSASRRTR